MDFPPVRLQTASGVPPVKCQPIGTKAGLLSLATLLGLHEASKPIKTDLQGYFQTRYKRSGSNGKSGVRKEKIDCIIRKKDSIIHRHNMGLLNVAV